MTTRCELSAQLDELYGLLATFEAAASAPARGGQRRYRPHSARREQRARSFELRRLRRGGLAVTKFTEDQLAGALYEIAEAAGWDAASIRSLP